MLLVSCLSLTGCAGSGRGASSAHPAGSSLSSGLAVSGQQASPGASRAADGSPDVELMRPLEVGNEGGGHSVGREEGSSVAATVETVYPCDCDKPYAPDAVRTPPAANP